MVVVARNLSYCYSRGEKCAVYALDGVTLTIPEGEFYGVIGHTGSGKSTFIQHINALIPLQSGELFVGEHDLSKKDKSAKKGLKSLRKKVGMVFQYPEYQLFAETVFEDVAFGVKNFYPEYTAAEVEKRVRAAITTVGLDYEKVRNASPFELSGGQKRRVAIAGVIAVEPEILILDEPCAGLDPQGKTALWSLLENIRQTTAKTVVVVSHDMNDVAERCTRAVMFDKGKVVAVGTPEELFSNAALIESAGLEVPVTCYLKNQLAPALSAKGSYKTDAFCQEVAEAIFGK